MSTIFCRKYTNNKFYLTTFPQPIIWALCKSKNQPVNSIQHDFFGMLASSRTYYLFKKLMNSLTLLFFTLLLRFSKTSESMNPFNCLWVCAKWIISCWRWFLVPLQMGQVLEDSLSPNFSISWVLQWSQAKCQIIIWWFVRFFGQRWQEIVPTGLGMV